MLLARLLAGFAMLVSAVAIALPADATSTGRFWSQGCYIVGETVVFETGPYGNTHSEDWQCGRYYLHCYWIEDDVYYLGCPGWQDFPITVTASASPHPNADGILAEHSGCDPGGACSSAVYHWTSAY